MIGLAKHPHCEQQELAMYLGQTEASISRQIRLMAAIKLIKVEHDKKDKRRRHVVLTQNGKDTFEKAQKLLEYQHREVLKVLDDKQVRQLQNYLDQMLLTIGCPEDSIGN
jgi:DNA-binding MarR family transcriptional regulator